MHAYFTIMKKEKIRKKIKLSDLVQDLDLRVVCGEKLLDREVTGGYNSDLLSDVIANAAKNCVWITLQGHQNIVAVAMLKEIAGIILVNNRDPDEETVAKAIKEKIVIMVTDRSSFETAGRVFGLLSKNRQ